MQYLVCYDIADAGRRDRVATALRDFGRRIQESVFLASLDGELAEKMRARVVGLLEDTEDVLHVFAVCDACLARTEAYGRAEIPKDRSFYIL